MSGTVFVVSHHEGLVAITSTRPHAERIVGSFVAQYRTLYGKPWIDEVEVFDETDDDD